MTPAAPSRIVDARLPFLATVCSPAAMTPVFNDRVLPHSHPGEVADDVTVEHISYTPGTSCVVLYAIRTGPADNCQPRWALATFIADKGRDANGVGAAGSVPLPEYGGLVEFFPVDAGLPSLLGALSPDEIGPLLVTLGLADAAQLSHPTEGLTIEVLRYTPRTRCVVRYELDDPTNTTPRELIGKVYRSGKRAAEAWRAQSALYASSSSTIRFPKPLALVEARCLVLMEKVAGDSMRDRLLADTGPPAEELVGLAASALASFHQLELRSERSPSIGTEVAALRKHIERLEVVAPDLARRAAQLLHKVSAAAERCKSGPPSPLHGDYTPSQLILGAASITIVDFDRVGFGDPAVDVGTFMAKLRRDAVLSDRAHLRRLPAVFLETYAARRTDDVAQRAIVMQSLVLTRIALSRLRQDPAASEPVASHDAFDCLLEEAAACLTTR